MGDLLLSAFKPGPQCGTLRGEQAAVELPPGRHARPMALATERRADRTDETDFPRTVRERMAPGHLARILRWQWGKGPATLDASAQLLRRHHHVPPPSVAVADIHVLDEAQHMARAAGVFDQPAHLVLID